MKEAQPPEEAWDFDVLIARAGYSRDGEWFLPGDVLREAAPLFEGAQAFANHTGSGGPDIRNLVGWHRDVRMGEEGLLSTFAVSRSASWFQALAHDALARGLEEPFGFSFDVLAQAEFREEAGGARFAFRKEFWRFHSVERRAQRQARGRDSGSRRQSFHYTGGEDVRKTRKETQKPWPPNRPRNSAMPGRRNSFLAACEDATSNWT